MAKVYVEQDEYYAYWPIFDEDEIESAKRRNLQSVEVPVDLVRRWKNTRRSMERMIDEIDSRVNQKVQK